MQSKPITAFVTLICLAVVTGEVAAQQPAGGRGAAPPAVPRQVAPMDYAGNWVSVVTEDWRWRMVTPPKGDTASIPLNAAGRKIAESWNPVQDKASGNECRAFGAAGLMRQPLRMRISWQDDTTLKLETDAGQQTRLLRFGPATQQAGERTWQGLSIAEWIKQRQTQGIGGGGGQGPVAGGHLKVTTTNMRAGYLRKNGVPYSENAVLTEYFIRHPEPDANRLTLISVVQDPTYLNDLFVTSTDFKLEPDASKWRQTGCEVDLPLE